jgi:hypothetical protein
MARRTEKLAPLAREARTMAAKLLPRPDNNTATLPFFVIDFMGCRGFIAELANFRSAGI